MSLRLFSSFIIKTKTPCVNCIHYLKYKYTYPCDELYDRNQKLGQCSIFGKQNLVSGEIEYENALVCRSNLSLCGKEGVYYNTKMCN